MTFEEGGNELLNRYDVKTTTPCTHADARNAG